MTFDVVIPSTGRQSLPALLAGLSGTSGGPGRVIVVDDRGAEADGPIEVGHPPADVRPRLHVLRGTGAGPAAARNVGWRAARAEWVAFLDDDVVPSATWTADLAADLAAANRAVAAVQGQVRVPRPRDRRATDWERSVAGLEDARWITADLAVRRAALADVGGFDERFPRAYREDADLGLRLVDAGWRIERGRRHVIHPTGTADRRVSVRKQAGNADDVLMNALHGPGWRERAGAPRGRMRRHAAITASGALALAAGVARRPLLSAVAAAGWAGGTAELAAARIAPGPRTLDEVLTMAVTSVLIPPAATFHRLRGLARRRSRLADAGRAPQPRRRPSRPPAAVLLDRDGTLVVDVPYNGDPGRVAPMPGAATAVARLREIGVPVGVVSNQSGVARGLVSPGQLQAVNARVEELLGRFDAWAICPHGPGDGCSCRKPAPGLVLDAADQLGVDPSACVVIGDIAADIEAAEAVGARGILVPNGRTRAEEVAAAPEVAPDLVAAVELAL
ncbi:MAG: HAD-IIIA family hydrolase [Solirubrobacteraceae bacterium]